MDAQIKNYTVSNWDSVQNIEMKIKNYDKLCGLLITGYLISNTMAAALLIVVQFI